MKYINKRGLSDTKRDKVKEKPLKEERMMAKPKSKRIAIIVTTA